MGFKDYLRVAAAAATDAVHELDRALERDADYAAARASIARTASSASHALQTKLAEIGETDAGQRVGEGTRKVGSTIAKTPVLSAVGDALSQQAGVPGLLALREQQPDDAWPLLWLSEALARLRRNRSMFLALRAPLEPLSAMIALTARTTGSLGTEDPVARCQLAAWSLAIRSLHEDPSHLSSLHVLARVYLARGFPQPAVSLAAMAALDESESGLALVTLGIASRQLGSTAQAQAAATQAVEQGCTLGHHLLAEYALDRRHYSRSLELRGLVTSQDRIRYFGVDPTASTVVRGAFDSQVAKTGKLVSAASSIVNQEFDHA